MRRFKEETKAPYPMLSDPGGKIAAQYGGLMPVVSLAKRASFVVTRDGKVKEIIEGGDAIDPGRALAACSLGK